MDIFSWYSPKPRTSAFYLSHWQWMWRMDGARLLYGWEGASGRAPARRSLLARGGGSAGEVFAPSLYNLLGKWHPTNHKLHIWITVMRVECILKAHRGRTFLYGNGLQTSNFHVQLPKKNILGFIKAVSELESTEYRDFYVYSFFIV